MVKIFTVEKRDKLPMNREISIEITPKNDDFPENAETLEKVVGEEKLKDITVNEEYSLSLDSALNMTYVAVTEGERSNGQYVWPEDNLTTITNHEEHEDAELEDVGYDSALVEEWFKLPTVEKDPLDVRDEGTHPGRKAFSRFLNSLRKYSLQMSVAVSNTLYH